MLPQFSQVVGAMLYIAGSGDHKTVSVYRLDGGDESVVTPVGTYGNFGVAAATITKEFYAVTLEEQTPSKPWVPSSDCGTCPAGSLCCKDNQGGSGACYGVDKCSEMHGGVTESGATFIIDVANKKLHQHFNSSLCWSLAPFAPSSGKLLCVEQTDCPNSTVPCGNNALTTIDLSSQPPGKPETIGAFPKGLIAYVPCAAFDPHTGSAGTYYVGLNSFGHGNSSIFGMDVSTGKITSIAPLYTPGGPLIHTFAYDTASKTAYVLVQVLSGDRNDYASSYLYDTTSTSRPRVRAVDGPRVNATARIGTFDLTTAKVTLIGEADPALQAYFQFNLAAMGGGGIFYITAFKGDPKQATLCLVGIDTKSGKVVSEHQRDGNFVDLAWWEGA